MYIIIFFPPRFFCWGGRKMRLKTPVRAFATYNEFISGRDECFRLIREAARTCFSDAEVAQMRLFGCLSVYQKHCLYDAIAGGVSDWTQDVEWSRAFADIIIFGINSFLIGSKIQFPHVAMFPDLNASEQADVIAEVAINYIWRGGQHMYDCGTLDDFARFKCVRCGNCDCHFAGIHALLFLGNVCNHAKVEYETFLAGAVAIFENGPNDVIHVVCGDCRF